MAVRTASCCCGQLRIACRGKPMKVSLWHCLDCQRRTGSRFGIAVGTVFDRDGHVDTYSRSGNVAFRRGDR